MNTRLEPVNVLRLGLDRLILATWGNTPDIDGIFTFPSEPAFRAEILDSWAER